MHFAIGLRQWVQGTACGRKGTVMEEKISIQGILEQAVRDGDVSDVFLVAGLPVTVKKGGRQKRLGEDRLMPGTLELLADQIYAESGRDRGRLERGEDDDFSFSMPRRNDFPGGRFRVNIFRQRGSIAAVIRVIRFDLPNPEKLGIPARKKK